MPFLSAAIAPADVLAAMITPAVLISASGTLALSTSNRLGRVMDRVRDLGEEAEKLGPDPDAGSPAEAAKRDLIAGQLGRLVRRIRILQNALSTVYLGLGLFVASSLTVGLRAAAEAVPGWVPAGLGLCGAAALLHASVLLVRETRLAVHSSLLEMASIQEVIEGKTGFLRTGR